MSAAIQKAKAHYKAVPGSHIDIPEWGEDGKPLKVYFRLLTVAQRRKCWRDEAGTAVDGSIAMVRAVMFHALDGQGKRLFDDLDEHSLTHEVDSDVVSRIGARILGFAGTQPKPAQDRIDEAKNA